MRPLRVVGSDPQGGIRKGFRFAVGFRGVERACLRLSQVSGQPAPRTEQTCAWASLRGRER